MKELNRTNYSAQNRKIKIMQFGEGNFLRAFVDWILQKLNDSGKTDAGVVVVQPVPVGRVADLQKQDGLYTLCLEGVDGGKTVSDRQIIDVLGDFVNPYTQYDKYLSYAHSEDLQAIVSNTTEAGIALDASDTDFAKCPNSFPGKLLALLKERYNYFQGDKDKGLVIIPCELIDNNGETLKSVLTELAQIRGESPQFVDWLVNSNSFTDTLVDRIVPGFPRDTVEEIYKQTGYSDTSVVKAEIFHLWVLKHNPAAERVLPVQGTGLNVVFADSVKPYKERKVKILNGAHTAMVPVAYLCNLDTVRESITDADVGKFVKQLVGDEIKPTINLPKEETDAFAASVAERFENPFIRHELMSIALNSTVKFRTRLLPTYNDYVAKFNAMPKHIMFAFAALCTFFKGDRNGQTINLQDSAENLAFWKGVWANGSYTEIARAALSAENIWEQNLASEQNVRFVSRCLEAMDKTGMRCALKEFLNGRL
ncbi:MAG: tagaturonate reductase [Corallococcus sp.]|nr:tagaturonate reductase [Corallococcus sp.]